MTRSRAKSKGVYAPLAANYYLDPAILDAGPNAELAWVRILSFLASIPSDGFVTTSQIERVISGIPSKRKAVETLVKVGLLEEVVGGFVARSWLKWNRTVEEMGRIRTSDQERKASESGANVPNSHRNDDGNEPDSNPQNSTEQSRAVQDRSKEKELHDSLFDEAWNDWPKKVDRADARRRFSIAARKVDPLTLARTIRGFGAAYAETTEKQFTPALGSWLNRERWTDELPIAPSGNRTPTRTEQNLGIVAQYAAAENQRQEIES